ncbi:MAG: transglycosylase domain-containing protein, partial [Bacteroidetes bacterium]|nr:transglycosylase domain-containing protein [Bacteroidota bacterium]
MTFFLLLQLKKIKDKKILHFPFNIFHHPFDINRYLLIFPLLIFAILLLIYWNILPEPLFDTPTSTVLNDRNGILLGARIANDDQWRFPYNKHIPEKFKKCIIHFEDKRFFYHPGFDPLAITRATIQNIKAGEVVSGGSTLTMQVIRLTRKGKPRTFLEKIIEIIMATRLEISYAKDEIIAFYA